MSTFSGLSGRNAQMLVASAIGVAALTAAYFMTSKSKGGSADEDLEPALTQEETVKIMTAVLDKFKMSYMSVMQYAAQIKQQYAQQGMQVDDAELMQHLLPQGEKGFQEGEAAVYAEFDVDASEVEDAVNSYLADGSSHELTEIVGKIRKLYKEMGGQLEDATVLKKGGKKAAAKGKKSASAAASSSGAKAAAADSNEDAEDDEDVEDAASAPTASTAGACTITTVDHFVGFVEAMAGKMGEFFDGYFDAFIAEYGMLSPNTSPEIQQRFQLGLMKLSEEVQQAFFVSTNMTEKHFESLLMTHQHDERVQMAFMKLQYATQSRLQARMAQGAGGAGAGASAGEEEEEVAKVEEL